MRKRAWWIMLAIFSFTVCGLIVQNVSAISSSLVVSQVQTHTISIVSTSASDELVELYNNSTSDTDITGWCVYYGQGAIVTLSSPRSLTCFNTSVTESDDKVMVAAQSYILLVSKAFADIRPGFGYDALFSNGLVDNDRWVLLRDKAGQTIDLVEWNGNGITSLTAEGGKTALSNTTTQLVQRKTASPGILKDTDNNFDDFERAAAKTTYRYGSIYEIADICVNITGFQSSAPIGYLVDESGNCLPPPVDVCTNIVGLQVVMPAGYELDADSACQPDVCVNMTGLQIIIPNDKEFDDNGNCVDHDYCINLSGSQVTVPKGYTADSQEKCLLDLLRVKINELLPNAQGSDDGYEFIELFNSNDVAVNLTFYLLKIGIDTPKLYPFPSGSVVEPHGYIVFSNDDIAFTLVNSSSEVSIVSTDDQLIDKSPAYSNPGDDMAWALINGAWDYTNMPTPDSENMPSFVPVDNTEEVIAGLQPCAANQYRNPETNRCRLLITVGSTLVACKNGQYRSEETNRCRNITSDSEVLAACDDNQYRNPATNRCKLIAKTDTELAACKQGQERNPDTNRCRNVTGTVPAVGFGVEPIPDPESTLAGWWAVAGVCLVALGYGVWEWRQEFLSFIRRIGAFFHSAK